MIKVFKKIILLIAVITVTAHSIFPHIHLDDIMAMVEEHHHHDELPSGTHHHDEKDNQKDSQHNLFSFARLDDDFIPANGQSQKVELTSKYVPAIIITFLLNNYPHQTKTHFGWYREYPPPDDYQYNLPSRAPPAII